MKMWQVFIELLTEFGIVRCVYKTNDLSSSRAQLPVVDLEEACFVVRNACSFYKLFC